MSDDPVAEAFEDWQQARRALDQSLGQFLADKAPTRELFLRAAELRRTEEVAWATLEHVVEEGPEPAD
jgi:hypothetical protein